MSRRLIDRIADGAVLMPAGVGGLVMIGDLAEHGAVTQDSARALAICVAITGALHAWFRAEDRWRRRRLLRHAYRWRRARQRALPAGCDSSGAPRPS